MIVKTTKPNRSLQAVYIYTDTSAIYILPLVEALKLKLRPGDEITDPSFFEKASLTYLLKEYALRQVAISPKSRHILSQKLTQKLSFYQHKFKYTEAIALDTILDYLEDRKLLDQKAFARHILYKNKNKPLMYIKQKLKQANVGQEDIQEMLSEVSQDHQIDLLKKHIAKLKLKYQKQPQFVQKQKILASLYQKGFPIDKALSLLDQKDDTQ